MPVLSWRRNPNVTALTETNGSTLDVEEA